MSDSFARRYKLLNRIAIGGTAEVFDALYFPDDGTRRPVVIKRVLPQFARDERFRRLFLEEACVAVTVTHPNIVQVIDHGVLEQTCYIAMERVEGSDLGKLLARISSAEERPSSSVAAYVVGRVGVALQVIHDKTSSEGTPLKIIHRDVSPQNILVSFKGDVKLTDFGIAKSAIRQETTVDGTLRGKLDYMAPEQAALSTLDRRTDIFALGCVLYEMVQGAPPFRGGNELETLDRIRRHEIRQEIDQLQAPAELRAVIGRALEPLPDERYQQADQLVDDLCAVQGGADAEIAAALGQWTRRLSQREPPRSDDAVDAAVRQLLGEDIASPGEQPGRATAVFASSSSPSLEAVAVGASSPRSLVRPLALTLAIVAGLGIIGWLLWGLRYFTSSAAHDGPRAAAPVTADGARDPAPAPRVHTPDSRPAHARVEVRSVPPGAAIFVDGRLAGRTPEALDVPARPFVLEIRKKGHRAWSRRLTPAEVTRPITARLGGVNHRPGSGLLTINSLPWSRVKIDGVFVGNTPLVKRSLSAGRHRVVLLAPGGAVRKRLSVTVRRGKPRVFTFDFTR